MQRIVENGFVNARPGELFACVPLTDHLNEDTDAGRKSLFISFLQLVGFWLNFFSCWSQYFVQDVNILEHDKTQTALQINFRLIWRGVTLQLQFRKRHYIPSIVALGNLW